MVRALISDNCFGELQDVHPPVKIPSELCQNDCSVTIIDTWYRRGLETDENIKEELAKADVVLLVYDLSKPDTIDRLRSFWCEFVTKHSEAPIVLVGNKADQKPNIPCESLEDIMRSLAFEFKQCEMIIECSAISGMNLTEVYTCAQKVVLFPTSPLYNSISKTLTPQFKKALSLIFRRCDKDKDFHLSDREVILMHADIFHTQLTEDDVDRIKEVIKQEFPEGVTDLGITLQGFFHLQKMMILRLKINVSWILLRHFGFDDNLKLNIEFVLKKTNEQSVELSRAAILYLQKVYEQYTSENLMKFDEFKTVFEAASSPPWDTTNLDPSSWREIYEIVPTIGEYFNLQSWLALWHMLTLQNYHNALLYLVYIGCEIPYNELFLITDEREIMEINYRRVVCVFLLGNAQIDKNWIVSEFLKDNSEPKEKPLIRWVCKCIEESQAIWESKYMVLANYPTDNDSEIIKSLALCDVAILVNEFGDDQDLPVESLLPGTLPKIKTGPQACRQANKVNEVISLAFTYSSRPFDGLDIKIKEKLLRNRKAKRNSILQVLGFAALIAGAIGFAIAKKKILI